MAASFLQGFQDLMAMPTAADIRYQLAQKAARGKAEGEAQYQAQTNEAFRGLPTPEFHDPGLGSSEGVGQQLNYINELNQRKSAGAGGTLDILNKLGTGGTAQLGFMSPVTRQGPAAEGNDLQKLQDEDEKRFWEAKRAQLGKNAFGELVGNNPHAPGYARNLVQQDYQESR